MEHGFTKEEFLAAQTKLVALEVDAQIIDLGCLLVDEEIPEDMPKPNPAYLLVMKGVVGKVLKIHKKTSQNLTNELKHDEMYDKKKYSGSAVLCYFAGQQFLRKTFSPKPRNILRRN